MKTILIALSAHSGYQPNFEACYVDLGGLEKHDFSTALLENSTRHSIAWFSINSHKASPLGPIFRLTIAVLNGFKVVIFVAMTKMIVTMSDVCV